MSICWWSCRSKGCARDRRRPSARRCGRRSPWTCLFERRAKSSNASRSGTPSSAKSSVTDKSSMMPLTLEWVDKAESDYRAMVRESAVTEGPSLDVVCFHAQQCAEKYLKARLQEAGLAVPRDHDLTALLHRLLPVEPTWRQLSGDLDFLTDFAVEFRYPGTSADGETARVAVLACRRFRAAARRAFALDEPPFSGPEVQ